MTHNFNECMPCRAANSIQNVALTFTSEVGKIRQRLGEGSDCFSGGLEVQQASLQALSEILTGNYTLRIRVEGPRRQVCNLMAYWSAGWRNLSALGFRSDPHRPISNQECVNRGPGHVARRGSRIHTTGRQCRDERLYGGGLSQGGARGSRATRRRGGHTR